MCIRDRGREKLKNDTMKYEEMKLKRRQNYKKLKEEGKIKSIKDLSSREQRKIRKEWKTRSIQKETKNQRNGARVC